ncbi:MAG: hypothetical protein R3D33_12440 [Hyphomicrobiaceae bacterium]
MTGSSTLHRPSPARPLALAATALLAALLPLAAGLFALAKPAHAGQSRRAMLILDGSGSMWGEMKGVQKTTAALRAIEQKLPDYRERIELGLMAFGHRRKGNCADIEQLLPVAALEPEAFIETARSLSPKGRTPLADTLGLTAEALGDGPSSIVLVIDGADTCKSDPCAAIDAIHKGNPDIVAHLVGLNVSAKDLDTIRCIPERTGGKLLLTRSPDEVVAALGEVLDASAGPVPVAEPAVPLPPELRLSATLGPGGSAVTGNLQWRIADLSGKELYAGTDPQPRLPLGPGDYAVEVKAGQVSAHTTVTVKPDGPTETVVPLAAGSLTLSALANDGGEPLDDVFFTLYRTDAAGEANLETLSVVKGSMPAELLPAGRYRVRAEHGLASVERLIVLDAGRAFDEAIVLHVGTLRISAVSAADGAPLADAVFTISEDDPVAIGGRRNVARSAATSPVFTLPAGVYHVTASVGEATATRDVTVKADEASDESIAVEVGVLALTSVIKGDGEALRDLVSYDVSRVGEDGGRGEVVASTSRPQPTLSLPAGRYLVEARLGDANARVTVPVAVRAGDRAELKVEHEAGFLTFRQPSSEVGATARDLLWEVIGKDGAALWSTAQVEPEVALEAGDYVLRLRARGRTREMPFSVATGARQTIEMASGEN